MPSTRREFLGALGAAGASLGASGRAAAQPRPRPNIVVILFDDMGFSDLGCYGGEIHTPNIDRLARGGLRFRQFCNTGRCCPTRASLLTGLYPHQTGVGWMMSDLGRDGYVGDLNRRCVTLGEALGPSGYGAYASGKWHVTKSVDATDDACIANWPRQRGFDGYYGTIAGAGSYFTPTTLTHGNDRLTEHPEGFYYTDAVADNAVRFIEEHDRARPADPFVLYTAFTAPHWPLHAKPEDIERYRDRYAGGWDRLRAERHERMLAEGLVAPEWPLTPRDADAPAWEDVDRERRANLALRMAVYAAQIDCADQGVGRIVAALDRTGRLDDTLILVLSDNGGCAEGGVWGFDRKEGGVLGADSTFSSYGLGWANASNTPYRLYKHWVHQGGIASPLIAHWPAGVAARGALRDQPCHLIDVMATCVDLSGADYPEEREDGTPVTPLEGRSLAPAFEDREIEREALFWEHEGNRALRTGQWKLVANGIDGAWELYDMEADRTELNDLAAREPARVRSMAALWESYAERCHAKPFPERDMWISEAAIGGSETRFTLSHGDALPRSAAPRIANRGFRITARVRLDRAHAQGVIVAQGGSALGWALYLKDGVPQFAVRGRAQALVSGADPLPVGTVELLAQLSRDGRVELRVAGEVVARGEAASLIPAMPKDGLEVGRDDGGAVGDYEAPAALEGEVASALIELLGA